MLKRPPIACLALISCLAFSSSLRAETEQEPLALEKAWSFSGFGTLGVVHAQANGATFIRDITEPQGASNRGLSWETDSRVGFQVNLKVSEQFEAVAQVVSHYRWDSNFQPELTWGFLKYSPNEMFDFRLGRIGFDAFMAADTRDVGYSFLWARPPVEYYGTLPFPYVDGGDFTFRYPLGNGYGRLKMSSGISRQKIPTNFGLIEDLSGSRVTGILVDYQDNHWTARLGKNVLRLEKEFPGAEILDSFHSFADSQPEPLKSSVNSLANDFSLVGKHISFSSIGLAYENGPLQTQMAVSHFTSQTIIYPESHSGYLSVGYRIDKLTPYAVISAVKSRKSSRVDELRATTPDTLVSIGDFMLTKGAEIQNTYTIGMRYDVLPNAALKFQMDVIRNRNCSPVSLPVIGSSPPCSSPLLWPVVPGLTDTNGNTIPGTWDGRAKVYSAVLDFTF